MSNKENVRVIDVPDKVQETMTKEYANHEEHIRALECRVTELVLALDEKEAECVCKLSELSTKLSVSEMELDNSKANCSRLQNTVDEYTEVIDKQEATIAEISKNRDWYKEQLRESMEINKEVHSTDRDKYKEELSCMYKAYQEKDKMKKAEICELKMMIKSLSRYL